MERPNSVWGRPSRRPIRPGARDLTQALPIWRTWVMDRYASEIVPTKAAKSQESNRLSLRRLRRVFGHIHPSTVLPRHYHQYKHKAAVQFGKTSINRDLEVLSHLLTMAVEWGVTDKNPLIGQVKKHRTRPRDRLVEDWEVAEVLCLPSVALARAARRRHPCPAAQDQRLNGYPSDHRMGRCRRAARSGRRDPSPAATPGGRRAAVRHTGRRPVRQGGRQCQCLRQSVATIHGPGHRGDEGQGPVSGT